MPSWMTAVSEADAAARRLSQATTSLERLSRELASLREWSETVARQDLAHELTRGADGGALNALVVLSSDEEADPASRRSAEALLERITSAIGLEPMGERGQFLKLGSTEVAEFEVRGAPAVSSGEERSLYCVARPGWCVDNVIVTRPLIEAVRPPVPGTPGSTNGES